MIEMFAKRNLQQSLQNSLETLFEDPQDATDFLNLQCKAYHCSVTCTLEKLCSLVHLNQSSHEKLKILSNTKQMIIIIII